MTDAIRLGRAIQARRKAVGLTQAELAAALELGVAQTVSDIERGNRAVKAWELVRLAAVLRTSIDALLGLPERDDAVWVYWRRGSATATREAEELFVDRARRYALLEEWNELPPAAPFPRFELDPTRATFPEVASLARAASNALDLGSRPAAALASVLQEVFRVKLFFVDLGEGESAAAARGDFGCAILLNANHPPWRRNYNLAHEVFHLMTWDATERSLEAVAQKAFWHEHVEKLANAFASHLLLPAEELEAQLEARFPDGEYAYAELVALARAFEVSTEALIWRLRSLNRLSQAAAERILADPEFRRQDRRSMPRHWFPTPAGPLPERYFRLALNAYQRGQVTLARLAKLLEMSLGEVGQLVEEWEDGQEAAAAPA